MIYRLLQLLLLPVFRRHLGTLEGIEHVPTDTGCILAANHIDYLDGFFLTAALLGRGVKKVRFLSETNNYWWTGGGTLPVDWSDTAMSIQRSADVVASGGIVCIFPEGRRNPMPQLLAGKTGVARIAYASGAPVVPVGIVGPSYASFGASVRALIRGRTAVEIRFGPGRTLPQTSLASVDKEMISGATSAIMKGIAPLCRKTISP